MNNQPERTMNDTPIPRTNEWETYCDECYYHMWRVRRKNERGFNDGFHVQNGQEAKQLVELLNKQDDELTAVTEQRDGLRSGIDYASDQLHKVTEQRDRLAEVLGNIMAYRKGEKPHDYWRLPFEERENAAFGVWMQIENSINQALQSLTANEL